MSLNIFDAVGHIRTDLESEAAAIEAMDEPTRASLMACLAASRAAQEGETRVAVARKAIAAKMGEHDDALAADQKANPPITHAQAAAQVSAANRPGYKPKPAKVDAKTRANLSNAIEELSAARAELTAADAATRALSAKRGDAILKWMSCQPKISAETVAREYQARSNEDRAKLASGEVKAKPEPVRLAEIDRVLSGRGKTVNRLPTYHGPR